eukprot:SAG31_NODE_1296_length_8945_cov_6.341510_4_plen_92_part_00
MEFSASEVSYTSEAQKLVHAGWMEYLRTRTSLWKTVRSWGLVGMASNLAEVWIAAAKMLFNHPPGTHCGSRVVFCVRVLYFLCTRVTATSC